MERIGPPVHEFGVRIVTLSFQFSGQLEVVGNPLDFLNDRTRDALVLRQAHINPLTPGRPIRGLARRQVSVRKQEVVFLLYEEAEAAREIHLMARKELLIAYTPLAVLKGVFHLPAEARLNDFLATMPDPFLPVTRAQLFLLQEFPSPFPTECDLLIMGQRHIQVYHIA